MRVFYPRETPTPGGGVTRTVAAEGVFKGLVSPLRLAIRLRVVPRSETDRGPNSPAKGLPHLGSELGPTVRNNVLRDSMQPDNMHGKEIGHLRCRWKLGKRDVVDRLGKTVHDGEDGITSVGRRESRDEVHTDV